MKIKDREQNNPSTTVGFVDLDVAKAAVLASLRSPGSRRCYEHAIAEFIDWYCSERRQSFNKVVVTRYRMHLESRRLAPGTVNLRLAAIRRLAYEAADSGLLSPEQVAGIRRIKGAKKLGVRVGNWLLANEARALWELPDGKTLKGKRDRAILSFLLACGLRRGEVAALELDDIQCREDHSAIVDLTGKGGHVRTVPVPDWVTRTIGEWVTAAGISSGKLFRCVCRAGKTWGDFMTDRVVWHVVKDYAAMLGLPQLAPHDLRRYAAWKIMPSRPSNPVLFAGFLSADSA
jgi:site-specific recombinase XerD